MKRRTKNEEIKAVERRGYKRTKGKDWDRSSWRQRDLPTVRALCDNDVLMSLTCQYIGDGTF